ncbi:cytochrome c oxidase subunit 3, partial [Priestia megaterium]|uniref:cytochrome c oxidase subunit 3 n=1 Tax=Priestia megaterium TaxID=1404 RepID=UPI002E247412
MKSSETQPLEYSTKQNELNIFGFWMFLGAEIMLFATLFTSYFVYEHRIGSGPLGSEIFKITPVIIETLLLLTSSFVIGLGINALRMNNKKATLIFFIITLLLGLGFLGFEIDEFLHYIHEGATIQTSAFTAILLMTLGTHGAHVTFGLFWGLSI